MRSIKPRSIGAETPEEKSAMASVNPKEVKSHEEVTRQLEDHAAE